MSARVTIAHVRAERLCARGARAWCGRHGIDWSRFVREGLPVAEVASIDDGFAQRLARRALAEVADGRA